MRVALVALALAIGTIVILALSDALSPSGIGSLSGGPAVFWRTVKRSGSSLESKRDRNSERIQGR